MNFIYVSILFHTYENDHILLQISSKNIRKIFKKKMSQVILIGKVNAKRSKQIVKLKWKNITINHRIRRVSCLMVAPWS